MLLAGCPGKKRCEKRCEDAADTELAKSEVIQTGHICFFQLAVCFWVLGLPLFFEWTGLKSQSKTHVSIGRNFGNTHQKTSKNQETQYPVYTHSIAFEAVMEYILEFLFLIL